MKKNYPLSVEGKNPERVLEAVKHDIRKYFKRERSRVLPKGVDFWDFDCQVGLDAASAEVCKVGAVVDTVGALAQDGAASVYVEILCKPGTWVPAPVRDTPPPAALGLDGTDERP